jgi:curved DNA-binding protein CbpA
MSGRKPKILTKEDILRAMKHTKSNRAGARYLGCSYQHYKKYAKLYKDTETGKTLFDIHLNQAGKGIRKHLYGGRNVKDLAPLLDILEGRIDVANYTPDILKARLIEEGFLKEECNCCGFSERRVVDYRVPLILNFKDKNNRNWLKENLEFLCYNCYFLNVGNVWSDNQLAQLEEYTKKDTYKNDDKPEFDLDENHIEHLKELGLWDDSDDDEFIDRL